MKDLAQHFLTDNERNRVEDAVKAAEKLSAGEIVVMIISSSYQYPLANVIGAATISPAVNFSAALTASSTRLRSLSVKKCWARSFIRDSPVF